jgi:S1-C subfamily serine protease
MEIPSTPVDVRRDATVLAVEQVLPAVVNVSARTWVDRGGDDFQRLIEEYYGYRRQPRAEFSRGSGVVIDPEGYVLTNVHVVADVDDIMIQFIDRNESLPAERIALSATKDIALLKIKAPPGRRFKAVKFAREDDLLLGETVMALGNPFGLGGSVSRGILSSKTRRAPESVPEGTRLAIEDWLQTDAAINPGNSGGPLVNLRGELIGINVAVLRTETGAQGIGFAVPIKRVNEALAEALTGESVQGLWFGARLQPGTRPLTVRSVQEGSPAAASGLEAGDVILEVNGRPAGSLIEFNRALVAAGAQRDLRLLVRRAASSRTLNLRLVEERKVFDAAYVRRRLGALVEPVEGGLAVVGVDADGPAARRLGSGMYLVGLDGQPTTEVMTLAKALHGKPRGAVVQLEVVSFEQRGFFTRRRQGQVSLKLR